MKQITIVALLAILFLVPVMTGAEETCDTTEIQTDIQAQLDLLAENPVEALIGIINLALAGLHDCSDDDHAFSGTYGAQPVLGPIALSPGFYIMEMITGSDARVVGVALSGCGKDVIGTLFNFTKGQAARGAEHLVEVETECTLYLELSKIIAPWTLTIDKIG